MSRVFLLLAVLLLGACGSSTSLPAPEILSVSPNPIAVNERAPELTIALDVVIPVHVDYSREEASPTTVQVWLGTVEVPLVSQDADGTLKVLVPKDMGPGKYDLRVALSDGREAVRAEALTIVPARDGQGDAGTPPEEVIDGGILVGSPGAAITGFQFETIGSPQQSGQSFEVHVRAMGPRAALFQDTVTLTLSKKNGSVSPTKLGPFTDGRLTTHVTVTGKGGNLKLTVEDPVSGAEGTSNGFKVH
jgi:hypothetical protein